MAVGPSLIGGPRMQRIAARQPARPLRYVVIALTLFFVAEVLANIGA